MSPFDRIRQQNSMSFFDRLKRDAEMGTLKKKLEDSQRPPASLFFCLECAGTGKWKWASGKISECKCCKGTGKDHE